MCTKRQQSSPLCSNNSVLLRALLVWMFNLQCVLWGTELPHCTILLATLLNICLICSVRLISFQVCSSRKEIPFQLYIFTTHLRTHTFSSSSSSSSLPSFCLLFLPHFLPPFASLPSSSSSLSGFLCSWMRVISVIISDWFSCLSCLSYRDRCILVISGHSCKCQRTIHTLLADTLTCTRLLSRYFILQASCC